MKEISGDTHPPKNFICKRVVILGGHKYSLSVA